MKWNLKRDHTRSDAAWIWPIGVSLMAVLTVGLLISGWIWWLATRNPAIPFLSRIGTAEWIVYPLVPDAIGRDAVEMTTVFRRSWWLKAVPTNAVLQVRAFGGGQITLNNGLVGVAPRASENWKKMAAYDVTGLLRTGTNEISVVVTNSNGPPALWLTLRSGNRTLDSDEAWQTSLCGAIWQPARFAATPMPIRKGNQLASEERCAESFMNRLPTLLFLAGLSLGILCMAQYLWRGRNASGARGGTTLFTSQAAILVTLAVGLWIILFAHNLKFLPALTGFDIQEHLAYIDYIRQHHALPLANEGWEMHHPPLYYLACAFVLTVFDLATKSHTGITALRFLGLILGLAQLGLVFASLRLIFPHEARKQIAGLILAAFMPVTLYMYQYVTNEILGATLATASVYCCLRILNSERAEVGLHAALGLCLGAALLSKITALVVALVILGTLAGRFLIHRERNVWKWLRTVGLTCLLCLVVSGWHYFRVWVHFGHILVGNFDRVSGFVWWQDPGYGTRAYFARFGLSLVAPLFSGIHGFADGLYSTLWGDGLCGGVASQSVRPPWNYDLMTAGYWLAVLPAILILAGLIAAVISLIARRQATWFLLSGLVVSMMAAMVFNQLKLPYYPSAKAFYGLPAMVSVCAFGAWGLDILTRRSRVTFVILWTWLGVWAMNSYASLWIQARAPYTRIALSRELAVQGNFKAAVEGFREVLQVHPQNAVARLALAQTLEQIGHTEEALQQYESAWRSDPHDPDCVAAMARVLAQQGKSSEAIKLVQEIIQDAPDHLEAFPLLGSLFAQQKKFDKAVEAYEEALRLKPDVVEVHNNLGLALVQAGRIQEALPHYEEALRLKPDSVEAHNNLGIALVQAGRIQEALGHFEQAARIRPDDAEAQYNLGLVLTQTGRFQEAIMRFQKALRVRPDYPEAQAALEQARAQASDHGNRNPP